MRGAGGVRWVVLQLLVTGYVEDLFPSSVDTDECVVDNGGCDHVCINTIGSRLCDCHTGYALNANGVTCDVTGEEIVESSLCTCFQYI